MASVNISCPEDTSDEASACKKCATQLGYWQDPFVELFCKGRHKGSPVINRGYYARYIGMYKCIDSFLGNTIGLSPQSVNAVENVIEFFQFERSFTTYFL